MRVLLLPYVYHNRELSACSSVTEMRDWLTDWLDRDDNLHVTWLVPPKEDAHWDDELLLADREAVDTITASRYLSDTDYRRTQGWTQAQLQAIADAKDDRHAYWDVVVNQNVYGGQYALWQFLHELYDWTFASSRPFHLISHLHDFNHPSKQHGARYPNDSAPIAELANHAYTDSIWIKSEADSRRALTYGKNYLSPSALRDMQDRMVQCGCAFDLDQFERTYSETPEYVHVAGTTEAEKNWDEVFEICELLYQRFNIETIRTTMKAVEDDFREADWCETQGNASYQTYLDALDRGDICFVAPDYATGGKTYFEQGASGQVMIFKDKPWVYDQMPEDYKLIASGKKGMLQMAVWAVKNWSAATTEHSRAMDHFESGNDKSVVGEMTHDDMRELVAERVDSYSTHWDEQVVEDAANDLDDEFTIAQLNRATQNHTDKAEPILDLYTYELADLVLCLKSLGYDDVPGREPRFAEVGR